MTSTTKAQQRAIGRLKKKDGPILVVGAEPDGRSIRVRRLARDIPADERDRIVTPTGLILEPVA